MSAKTKNLVFILNSRGIRELRKVPKDHSQSPNDIVINSITTQNGSADGNCPRGDSANPRSIADTAALTKADITRNICQCFARSRTFEIDRMKSANPW